MQQNLATPQRRWGLTANMLRTLALGLMLLDHMWATLVPGNLWMTCAGRLAFPIFAFQITEGFLHTSNVRRYGQRLLVFALISEVPFNLMLAGSPVFPFHQNVLFTLLLGLAAISALDKARKAPGDLRRLALSLLIALGCMLLGLICFVDYSAAGVATVILFYLMRGFKGAWLGQLAGMILIHCYLLTGMDLPVHLFGREFFFPVQGFAVLSLGLIWLYNGRKGTSSKALQYAAYAFYPVHMLVLYTLSALR